MTAPSAILLGHRGYVGSAFAELLEAAGVAVTAIDRSTYESQRGRSADYLINVDGDSDRRLSETDPLTSFRANVASTMASLTELTFRRYVLISTVAVYDHPAKPSRNHEAASVDPLSLGSHGFLKHQSEMLVRRYAASWLIVRLGPVVGRGIRKNSVYDLLARRTLFFHPDSRLPYLGTRDVARIVWQLRDLHNETFNLTGDGTVRLGDLARELGVEVTPEMSTLPLDEFDVSLDRIKQRTEIPRTVDVIADFVAEWRRGLR